MASNATHETAEIAYTPTGAVHAYLDLMVSGSLEDFQTHCAALDRQVFPDIDPELTPGRLALDRFEIAVSPGTDTEVEMLTLSNRRLDGIARIAGRALCSAAIPDEAIAGIMQQALGATRVLSREAMMKQERAERRLKQALVEETNATSRVGSDGLSARVSTTINAYLPGKPSVPAQHGFRASLHRLVDHIPGHRAS